MTTFDPNESLGNRPLNEQVQYLLNIGDYRDAALYIADMFKFAPQVDNMRLAVSAYISNPGVSYGERIAAWFDTPECLKTIKSYTLDDDEAIEAVIPEWTLRVSERRGEEVDLRYVLITGDEYGLEEIDMARVEMVEYKGNTVPKVIVDYCIQHGIHGFINDW